MFFISRSILVTQMIWKMIGHVILLQSLLAALGSIQFVSNIAFAYVVLNKTISVKYVYLASWDHINKY